MYSEISKMKEVKFYQFTVLYHRKEKIWFLYLEYSNTEKEKDSEEMVTTISKKWNVLMERVG